MSSGHAADLLDLPDAARRAHPAPPASAARPRKLHVGHFAFVRAIVQGVTPSAAWDRYLRSEGDSGDARLVRSTVAWIREDFAAAAKREDRHGTARLLKLDLSRIPDPGVKLPTLEAFAEEHSLQDESESEQIAAFEAEYGKRAQIQNRRGRLIERQLAALRWLEELIAQPPRAGDSVAAWLDPTLANLLEAADLFTLAQLIERINGIGQHWFGGIKSLGAGKAARIVAWCKEHQATLGMALGAHIEQPRLKLFSHELSAVVAPASDIRPLEKFLVPYELDGARGAYRRPQSQCLLQATNDYQAILAWLRSKQGLSPEQKAHLKARRRHRDLGVEQGLDWLKSLSHTQRAYRKEAERFLLWAIVQRGKALSSMTNEDCVAYREFLADPSPRSRWCGPRSRERWSPLWRPFEGPVAASGQRQALTILKNLYGFLVDQNYLMGNPWSAVGVRRSPGPKVNAGRSFTVAQWAFAKAQLALLPDTSANARMRFALALLYATGLRLSEVVAATVDDLVRVEYPADQDGEALEGWMLTVLGKGSKERQVPVPDEVVAELGAYLRHRGLGADPGDIGNQGAHLLGLTSDLAERAPGLYGRGRGGVKSGTKAVLHGAGLNRAGLNGAGEFDARIGVAVGTLANQLKAFFRDCGAVLRRQGDLKGAERFEKASTHWMRHSHASHAIAKGMPIEIAQQNLGHASLATTTVYVTTEAKRRLRAVKGFWGES